MLTCLHVQMLTCSHDQMFICSYLLSTAHDPQTNSRVRCMRTFTQAYYIKTVKIYEGQLQLGRLRVSNLFPSFTLTSDLVQQEDLHGVIFGSQTQNQVATLFISFKGATCTPKFMPASSLNPCREITYHAPHPTFARMNQYVDMSSKEGTNHETYTSVEREREEEEERMREKRFLYIYIFNYGKREKVE